MRSVVYVGAGTTAAKVAGLDPEMDRVAAEMATAIRTVAATHRKTGTYDRSVRVRSVRGRKGVMDRVVEVTDPAAEHIEWGHAKPGDPDDDSGDGDGELRWVPGLRIVTRAFQAMR